MEHSLKTDPKLFKDIWNKMVDFSVRNNDRNFQIGDTVIFRETLHSHEIMKVMGTSPTYTGFKVIATINFVSRAPQKWVKESCGKDVVICFKINKWVVDFVSINRKVIDGKKRLVRIKERNKKRTIEI